MPNPDLAIRAFILTNYKNCNARSTRDAILAHWRHIEAGGRMFRAMGEAMSSAQLGISLWPAIREGLIHGLSVTGANLEEALFRFVAHRGYKDFPHYRYLSKNDDTLIFASRMRRGTDTSIPEEQAFRAVESSIVPRWKRASGDRRFWHEASTLSNIFASYVKSGECSPSIVKSGVEYMADFYTGTASWLPEPVRLFPDRRGNRGVFPHLRCAFDEVRPFAAGQASGVLLPDQRLDHVARLLFRRHAERKDHIGQAHGEYADVCYRIRRNPRCSAHSPVAARVQTSP